MDRRLAALLVAVPVAAASALALTVATGAPAKKATADYIEGTVTSAGAKPEAGVWVIAEAELGTTYRKIVVTDSKGRFVLPQLPNAKYRVWVRGYGLQDSQKVGARPGQYRRLQVKTARTKVQAAEIYPANYWLSLFNPPDTSTDWANTFKGGCMLCHQIGNKATRSLDTGTTRQAYDAGTKEARTMYQTSLGLGRDKLLDALADWSQRIAKGETPPNPPRPSGKERDLVITQWNWGTSSPTRTTRLRPTATTRRATPTARSWS